MIKASIGITCAMPVPVESNKIFFRRGLTLINFITPVNFGQIYMIKMNFRMSASIFLEYLKKCFTLAPLKNDGEIAQPVKAHDS
jgi:hypothetical protein